MIANHLIRGLRDQLVDRLRDDVLSGRYKEGEAIRQSDVVARYGVSRTPVREALIQLAQEGLVTTVPHRGVRVASRASDSVQQFLIPIRRVIEVYALRLCFDDLDDADLGRWETILGEMRQACEAKDYASLAERDIAFHRSILERSGEPALVAIWSMIVGQVRDYFHRALRRYDDLMEVYHEHAAIIEKIREGDANAALEYLGSLIGEPEEAREFLELHGVFVT